MKEELSHFPRKILESLYISKIFLLESPPKIIKDINGKILAPTNNISVLEYIKKEIPDKSFYHAGASPFLLDYLCYVFTPQHKWEGLINECKKMVNANKKSFLRENKIDFLYCKLENLDFKLDFMNYIFSSFGGKYKKNFKKSFIEIVKNNPKSWIYHKDSHTLIYGEIFKFILRDKDGNIIENILNCSEISKIDVWIYQYLFEDLLKGKQGEKWIPVPSLFYIRINNFIPILNKDMFDCMIDYIRGMKERYKTLFRNPFSRILNKINTDDIKQMDTILEPEKLDSLCEKISNNKYVFYKSRIKHMKFFLYISMHTNRLGSYLEINVIDMLKHCNPSLLKYENGKSVIRKIANAKTFILGELGILQYMNKKGIGITQILLGAKELQVDKIEYKDKDRTCIVPLVRKEKAKEETKVITQKPLNPFQTLSQKIKDLGF